MPEQNQYSFIFICLLFSYRTYCPCGPSECPDG